MTIDIQNQIELENERVLLRPLIVEDQSNLAPIAYKNKNLLQFSPSHIFTPELLRLYIKNALQEKEDTIRFPFIIYDKKKLSIAGSTSFINISNKNERVEIGHTWIGENFQGTLLNDNMKYLMLEYAFEKARMERVEFKTDARNLKSRKAIEKLGAQYEGNLRSHTLMADGYRRDTVYYSILKSEWDIIKNNLTKKIKITKNYTQKDSSQFYT